MVSDIGSSAPEPKHRGAALRLVADFRVVWKLGLGLGACRLWSTGPRRVGHDWATSLPLFTFMRWRRQGQPTPVFSPGESRGRGSLGGCRLWGPTGSGTTDATQQQVVAWASLVARIAENPPATPETGVWPLGGEDALEMGMATHSSILAWRIPWTEEPGGPQSIISQRAGHDWSNLALTYGQLTVGRVRC